MIAALPWYDFPAVADRTDALWSGLRRHLCRQGIDAPEGLGREHCPYGLLENPLTVLTQTCGYVAGGLARGMVRTVLTPDYALDSSGDGPLRRRDRRPGDYFSVIVARRADGTARLEDYRGARCAANDPLSHSGVNALRPLLRKLAREGRFFAAVQYTGGHMESLARVVTGLADVACIDAVTFGLAQRFARDRTEPLVVLATTRPAAAPPLVVQQAFGEATADSLRKAVRNWLDDPAGGPARRELLWNGAVPANDHAYARMARGGAAASARGLRDFGEPELWPNGRSNGGCSA